MPVVVTRAILIRDTVDYNDLQHWVCFTLMAVVNSYAHVGVHFYFL